jgi:hypothetical protein
VRRFTWFWIVLALFSYHRRNNTGAIRNPSRIMLLFAASLTAGSISTDLLGMSYGGQHPEHVCSCVAILASSLHKAWQNVDGALRRWTFSKDGASHHDASAIRWCRDRTAIIWIFKSGNNGMTGIRCRVLNQSAPT